MALLTAHNIGQAFGEFDVFTGVSGSIPDGGKVGLVGPNGVGKTTLLLILAGLSQPSAGSVQIAKGTRLGYLPQEAAQAFAGQENSVFEEMLTVFDALREDEATLRQMEQKMANGDHSETLLSSYSQLQERFEHAGGYDYQIRIRQVLTGLGFAEGDWRMPLPHLSGGQKTRVLLGRLLLEKPDLLIMDEPTNHLDVAAIEWLEGMLKTWDGAILVVSHDRYFLDRVVSNIWEMSSHGLQRYRGNYSAYVQQRQERWQKQIQAYEDFRQHIAKEMDFIRRNIAGQRTQMAQGKLSRLAREVTAVLIGGLPALAMLNSKGWLQTDAHYGIIRYGRVATTVGELQQQIGELRPPIRPSTLRLNLDSEQRSGELVLRTKELTIGYPSTKLFTSEDIELRRLECAALIGPNGAGKTTFLKTALEPLEPLHGEVILGASLQIGYFAQAHDGLNLENTVLDELLNFRNLPISEARNYLARFLFREDDVYKKVSMLSGGERGRLALAILALQGANFLLLDEPTNHLDIPSQEALQEALEQFNGTILMVSHDRYLVNALATQIWALADGRLRVYAGGYQNYLDIREQEAEAAKAAAARMRAAEKAARSRNNGSQLSKNELRKQAEALVEVEQAIEAAEAEIAKIGDALQEATTSESFAKIQTLSEAYATAEAKLADLMEQWETLHE
ncbi:ribosomal protection-like ABC-F family protein [Candidatus Leptofilum sp.]|uniref:ribosomal protection-like ABC-F family protein n=1 Tax=Candidatus Leptofilum sp. TaxID=3241576 RepID=UPI003B5CF4EA